MQITAILPVSRAKYLNRVLESLKNQTYKPNNLIVVFDGSDEEYIPIRNTVSELDYESVLCVKSVNTRRAELIPDRRRNIVRIHNQFRELIGDTDWIFSIEDDGILPSNALERLVKVVESKDDVGMVTGVELGRWGVAYVGAWVVDDPHDVKRIVSIDNKTREEPTVDEIDACGLYCALIRADKYKEHQFFTYNGLGPDVNLGIFLRQQGFKNYIDWGIPLTHLTNREGFEIEIPATDNSQKVTMTYEREDVWRISR